jgi:WD40 repeat protein
MSGAFISYAREDQPFAQRLYDALFKAGREPTWDQDHKAVPFSAPWRPEIATAIDNSDKFIFVISPESLDSEPCANELRRAGESAKQVIPVLRRRVREDQSAPPAIGDLNWIFFDDDERFQSALDQLIQVLDTDLDWLKAHTRLLGRSSEWAVKSSDRSLLLRGNDLRDAEVWLAEGATHPTTAPTDTQRKYITESRRIADRTTRIQRSVLAGGLVIALVLGAVAFIQRNQARHESTVAQARALAAESVAELTTNPTQSLRDALDSTRINPSPQGIQALRLALSDDHLRMAFQPGFGFATQAAWNPVEQIIAATGRHNSVQLWDPRTGRLLSTLGSLPTADPITQLLFNPSGSALAAVSQDGMIAMWDVRTGSRYDLSQLNDRIHAVNSYKVPYVDAAWDPHASTLYVYGSSMRDVLAVSVESIKAVTTAFPETVVAWVPSPSGAQVFALVPSSTSIGGYRAEIFSHSAPPVPLETNGGPNETACWTPDGSELVTWDPVEAQDQNIRIFNATTGSPLLVRPGGNTFSAAACGVVTRPGPPLPGNANPYVAVGDYAGNGTLVQVNSQVVGTNQAGRFIFRKQFTSIGLYGHTLVVNSVAVTRDGAYIATGSDDGTVRIWSALTGRPVSTIVCDGQPVDYVQFSPDGGLVLAVERNGVVRVADSGTGEAAVPLQTPPEGNTYALGFVGNGTLVYGLNQLTRPSPGGGQPQVTQETTLIWHLSSGRLAMSYRLPAPPTIASPATCLPNQWIISLCGVAPPQESTGLTVSPDGAYLAYVTASGVTVRNLGNGQSQNLNTHGSVTGLMFAGSPGDLLIMTNQNVVVWQPLAGGHVWSVSQTQPPNDAELSADGTRLVTANSGGSATVWDVRTGRPIESFVPRRVALAYALPERAVRVAINSAGTELGIGTNVGSVDLWRIDDRHLVATRLLSNDVTNDEFAITELGFAGHDSEVLATNYPQRSSGLAEPPGTAVVLSATTGGLLSRLNSPAAETIGPTVNPGISISPDGGFILAGVAGFAPAAVAPTGDDAVYDLAHEEMAMDLQGTVPQIPPVINQVPNLTAVDPWAPDGVRLLTGAPAVYACDACGNLTQLQTAATTRLAWTPPLSPGHDNPPNANAFS